MEREANRGEREEERKYMTGSITDLVYATRGSSEDWAYAYGWD
jgi:hypothetical protein